MSVQRLQVVEADWWAELSPAGKKEYIAEHPTSKHAKEAIENDAKRSKGDEKGHQDHDKAEKGKDTAVEDDDDHDPKGKHSKKQPKVEDDYHETVVSPTNADKEDKKSFKNKLKSMLARKELPEAEHKFFEEDGIKAGSTHRAKIAKHVKGAIPGMIQHLKGQGEEWKHGITALHKIAKKQTLTPHDKEALKAISKDILITVGSVAVTGGLGHGVVLALSHFGFDLVKDMVLKASSHGLVEGKKPKGAMPEGHHASFARLLEEAAKPKAKKPSSNADDKLMQSLLEQLSEFIENGDIPDSAWEHAVTQLSKKKSRENVQPEED